MATKTNAPRETFHAGQNVQYWVDGNELHVVTRIDPKTITGAPLSSSGKNKLTANSGGWVAIAEPKLAGMRLMFQVTAPKDGLSAGPAAG